MLRSRERRHLWRQPVGIPALPGEAA